MKKILSVVVMLLFLAGPAFLSAQAIQGNPSGDHYGLEKGKRVETKSGKAKKTSKKKHSKTKKSGKTGISKRDAGTLPKSPQ